MEGNPLGGDDEETHNRTSPVDTETGTVVLPSASERFSLREIQEAFTAAWDGQSSDVPLVHAVHNYLPGLQQAVSTTERNTSLEEENKRLKDEALEPPLGRYTAAELATEPQTTITHLENQRKDLEEKLKNVETILTQSEDANRDKDQQIEKLSATVDSHTKANAKELSRFQAEKEVHERQKAKLEEELRQAQRVIAENNTDFEDENRALYTKKDLSELARTQSESLKTNAEDLEKYVLEIKACKTALEAEKEAHDLQVAKVKEELRKAQEVIAKHDTDPENEERAMYTKNDLSEIARTHSETLQRNAEDMGKCISENKAHRKQILKLEAELQQAIESARSSQELQARIDLLMEGTEPSGSSSPDGETRTTVEELLDEATILENENQKLKAQIAKLEAQATISNLGATIHTLSGNIEREREVLSRAATQNDVKLQTSLDEGVKDRTRTQFRTDELGDFQKERAALQEQVDELRNSRSELRKKINITYKKELQSMTMYKAIQGQMKALNGVGDEAKNEEIKRLESYNEALSGNVSDRDITIGELREELAQAQGLLEAGNSRIKELRSKVEELKLQKSTDDEEISVLRTQAEANLQIMGQMEADRNAAAEKCNNEKQALSQQIKVKDGQIREFGLNTVELNGDLTSCNQQRSLLQDQLTQAEDELGVALAALERYRQERYQLEQQLDGAKVSQNALEDVNGALALSNEERDRLRVELANARTELARRQQEHHSLQRQLDGAITPQNTTESVSGELALCNEERDGLRIELANARAALARCQQESRRLEIELAGVSSQTQRTHGNGEVPNEPSNPNAPYVPDAADDDLARCRADNADLTLQLQRAHRHILAIERAENSPDPRAALARLEDSVAESDAMISHLEAALSTARTNNTHLIDINRALKPNLRAANQMRGARNTDLRARDETIAQLRADMQAAHADIADIQNLNTYLQDRLGQLLHDIFSVLREHLGLAPPSIASRDLNDVAPWLGALSNRLRARDGPREVVPRETAPRSHFLSFLPRRGSCAACAELAAVAGDLDQTYLLRREDFEGMRARVDGIVWGLEDRVRGLERQLEGRGGDW
ncbi:hypothetical protein MMC26_002576 [Xylographa opegraphella]|nr:hypothetical protein [Xylographa opegraphella]